MAAAEPAAQCDPNTTGVSVAGGVLRLRPQCTVPSIITMPTPASNDPRHLALQQSEELGEIQS
jgi:hypothetical protein